MPLPMQNIPNNFQQNYPQINEEYDSYVPQIMPQGNLDANFVQQINPEIVVENIFHSLSGEVWDYKEGKWVRKLKPFLNELGVNTVITVVRSIVNQNTTMSNLDSKIISNIIVSLGDELACLFMLNWKDFDIEKANLTPIVKVIQNMAYFALMRAYLEGERDLFKNTVRSAEQYAYRGQPEDSGMFGKAKNMFSKMFNG